jgi:hypothetical protein
MQWFLNCRKLIFVNINTGLRLHRSDKLAPNSSSVTIIVEDVISSSETSLLDHILNNPIIVSIQRWITRGLKESSYNLPNMKCWHLSAKEKHVEFVVQTH